MYVFFLSGKSDEFILSTHQYIEATVSTVALTISWKLILEYVSNVLNVEKVYCGLKNIRVFSWKNQLLAKLLAIGIIQSPL